MNNKLALLVSIVLGVLSIVGIQLYIQKVKNAAERDLEMVNVFVAMRDIEAGEEVKEKDVEKQDIPQKYERRLGGTNVKNRTLIVGTKAQSPIISGQIIQSHHVVPERGKGKGLSVDPGWRALTIPVDAVTGLATLLRPGDFVAVLGNFESEIEATMPDGNPAPTQFTMTVLPKSKILAIDRRTERSDSARFFAYQTVTLRLRPAEANLISHVVAFGKIQLSLVKDSDEADSRRYSTDSRQLIDMLIKDR